MKKLIAGLLLVGSFNFPVQAAIIYLRDGSQLKGTIVSATARDVLIHTDDGNSKAINTDRIARVDYTDSEPQPEAVRPPPPAPVQSPEPRYVSVYRAPWKDTGELLSLGFGTVFSLSRVDFSSTGGGTDSNGSGGLSFGGQYLHKIAPHWATGVDAEYLHRSWTHSQSLLPSSETNVSGDSGLFLGLLKYSFVDQGFARPYLMGGVGGNVTTTFIQATPNFNSEWSDTHTFETRTLVDQTHWGFASTVRLGVDFSWFEPSVFSVELGWNRFYNPRYNATPAGQDLGLDSVSGNLNNLNLSFRWGWRF